MALNSQDLYVSIIVISFNSKRFIDDCLTSLLDQDIPHDNYEVIFVDNRSTDGSSQYVKKNFPSVKVLELERNYGAAEGYNRAAKYSSAKYVAFLNIDTLLHKKWLSEMLRAMNENSQMKACHSNMIMPWTSEFSKMDRDGFPHHTYIYDLSKFGYTRYYKVPFSDEIIKTLFLSGDSVVIEKKIVDETGYAFDSDLPSCPDIDLGLRINSLGYETGLVPTSLVFHKSSTPTKVPLNFTTFRNVSQLIQDRFVIYFKNMYTLEFLTFLPFLLFGAPLKVREFGWSRGRQIIYGIGSIPLVFYAFFRAIGKLPRFRVKRNETLKRRKGKKWWLLNELLKR